MAIQSFLGTVTLSPGLPGWLSGEESACDAEGTEDATGLIPGSGRSPGGGHGDPLQCSCLANALDRGACPWLQSKGLQRVRHDLATECVRVRMCLRTHTHTPSPTPSPALSLFWIFRAGALQGIHEQSSAQGARVGVPQAACPGRCVCAHVCVCIVFACLYTHACVVMCAETHLCPQPLESRSPRPPSQDLRLCRSYRTKLLCGWEPTLTPPGASPAAPQMPGPAGSTRVPHRGWDVTGLPGDAHRLPLSEGGGQASWERSPAHTPRRGREVTGLPEDTHGPPLSGGVG